MNGYSRVIASSIYCLMFFYQGVSQQIDSTLFLPEILVIAINADHSPFSARRDSVRNIDRFQPTLKSILDRQIGIFTQNQENFAQDLRISIRGFGARSAFGIRGIRMYMDDIPLTSPDGTTQIDELSVYDIASLSVLRSGMSSLLGNAGGGAILLQSQTKPSNHWEINSRANQLGSYDIGLKKHVSTARYQGYYSAQHQRFRGQRDYSSARNTSLYTTHLLVWSPSFKTKIIASAYVSPEGTDPGGLTLEQINTNRYQANTRNLLYLASEKVKGGLVGQHSQIQVSDKVSLLSTAYIKRRTFEGKIPSDQGGVIDLDRAFGGIQNRIQYSPFQTLKLTVGHQWDQQKDTRTLFNNIQGAKGELNTAQDEIVTSSSLTAQVEYEYRRLSAHAIIRYDHYRYKLISDISPESDRPFDPINYSIGLGYKVNKQSEIYTSFHTSFELPTLNELSNNPTGQLGFNLGLQPETSNQLELGYRYSQSDVFQLQCNVFYVMLQNQILPYEIANAGSKTFYQNIGLSNRIGLETQIDYLLWHRLNIRAIYQWNQFEYIRFNQLTNYKGNQQTVTPMHRFGLSLGLVESYWLSGTFDVKYQSSMFLDDANKVRTPGFADLAASIYSGNRFSKRITIGVQLNNLLNTVTYSNFRANAAGGRYFEASSERNAGIFMRWQIGK